ncbi:MAG TPA: response regulator transcription factor [Bryobacteraceae bacterium]|nr:response regulator transcription factor [Bryobacteraceae bacterium]
MDTIATTSLLIADEYPLIREGIARLCEASGRFHVLPGCADGPTASQSLQELQPDLGLIDYSIPRLFSLELVRQIRESGCRTRILLMSSRGDRKMALEALRAGATGFLLKSADGAELFEALGRVRSGSIYVSPQLEFEKVFLAPAGRSRSTDPIESLSSREYQVFQLLVDGIRAKDIASRLQLSPKTVDTYRASLMRKLDIHDVAGLVKYAIQREITTA